MACHVARAGGTVEQLTWLLLHPEHEGGRHAQVIALRSGHARAQGYVERVWASALALVESTTDVASRGEAHEDLARLRECIETTSWRGERGRTALRVLRAHLNFAQAAGGRLHFASERQAAEEAGISRQTLRQAYELVLKPGGWLRRLRVGSGTEGSTWYLADGPAALQPAAVSRDQPSQCPPDGELGEWTTPETDTGADVDSRVIGLLMGHDAFAHHALGSSALMVIGALHARPGQTPAELTVSASLSRATAYRTVARLEGHGLVQRSGAGWSLTVQALQGVGDSLPEAVTAPTPAPAAEHEHAVSGWGALATAYGTAGVAAVRRAMHAAERAAYRAALAAMDERRSPALTAVVDGRTVLVPGPRADEIPAGWHGPDGTVLDPVTGRAVSGWQVATDGRLILLSPGDDRSYDELVAAHTTALHEWETAA
ncbi:hypothetical protein DN069_27575 [Streptacidiphilus pinicola]|uniref:HTH iclR-type domain-containing protein n=1 Tax=Streptacidiphilus pinicola TaxID=2219663 RepID=A0A2X0IBZ3_9ACTN|nr:hypothetical protein DN069_27575 [Streptacidiphilus pinicola]